MEKLVFLINEDTLNSTRSAVEEGIVCGGTALINVRNAVATVNAGEEGSIIVKRLKKEAVGIGYNAAMFLTTEAVEVDKPKPVKLAMPDMGRMGGTGGIL